VLPCLPDGTGSARRILWQQATLPRLAKKEGVDVLFCPGNTAPLRSAVPTVVVLQNAAPFCESITWRSEGIPRWSAFQLLGAMMRHSAATAKRVIFISELFRQLFISKGFCAPSSSELIYLGREQGSDAAGGEGLPGIEEWRPFALCVSHLYPYKRLANLIEGYATQRQGLTRAGVRLLIVGKPVHHGEYRKLRGLISRHGLDGQVCLYGEVPQESVSGLMQRAEFFVFQSTCENCPSTLIEALASGLPVACSNASVMPEIAGAAASYFDPFDPADIGLAMLRLATDEGLRTRLSRDAVDQARRFPGWDAVAAATMQVLKSAAHSQDVKSCAA
jgi:glycosyltransferase involved in cell wall biosynthesis